MTAFLGGSLTAACLCWRLERRDGVALGFTTHDRDLMIDGLVYGAAPGMLPSAVSVSDGLDPDSVDVKGALTGAAISAADLRAGRWDGARLTLFLTDWMAPGAQRVAVTRGALGEISQTGAAFTAELNGPTAALDAPVVEQTSPTCRASLGDKRCRVDMARRTQWTRVTGWDGDRGVTMSGPEPASSVYGYGRLRWIGGRNSGLESQVRASDADTLSLREPPAFPPVPGDLILLSQGCDRRFETCVDRFANGVNFRGEPHLPGIDLLTRYPGA